jgi:DNA-binding MarR family transcriptional regulator
MKGRYETFTVLINRISRNIRKIKNIAMAEHNLRSVHVSCLYYLYSAKNITSTDLCELCEEDKATISRALDFLQKNGYLAGEENEGKRYKTTLILTLKGNEVGREIVDKVNGVLRQTGFGFTEKELVTFYRSLTIISNNLESIVTKWESESK